MDFKRSSHPVFYLETTLNQSMLPRTWSSWAVKTFKDRDFTVSLGNTFQY